MDEIKLEVEIIEEKDMPRDQFAALYKVKQLLADRLKTTGVVNEKRTNCLRVRPATDRLGDSRGLPRQAVTV